MKLIFSLFFLIFAKTLFAGDISSEYIIKVKGLTIGTLNWNLEMTDTYYNFSLSLKNKGFLSNIYNFNGSYSSFGKIEKGVFIPNKYKQKWQTKNKKREVEIVFVDRKILSLSMLPTEKESPRINIRNLVGYVDPLTSFLKILIFNKPSSTTDGRRIYTLSPERDNTKNKILIKKFKNIWADHKRNDLEYLILYQENGELLPAKIEIKFQKIIFNLTRL